MANEPSEGATGSVGARRPLSTRTRWIIGIVAFIIVAPIVWLGIHAFIAYDALINAEADVGSVQASISTNQFSALPYIYDDMKSNTETAAAVTTDPVWLLSEHLPIVGPNLRAVRQVAQSVNGLVISGVGPIANEAKTFDFSDFRPKNGRIDVTKVEALLPVVDSAYRGVRSARISADAIDTSHTLGPVTGAIANFRTLLGRAETEVENVRSIAQQIPPTLGSSGTRDYLVVLGTNADDRANGGAAAALSLVSIDHGKLVIERTEPASSIGAASALPTAGIPGAPPFADAAATKSASVSDAERSPVFPQSAANIAAAWTAKFGGRVDAVVSIDTTGLGYLAGASGSVTVSDGKSIPAADLASYLDVDQVASATPAALEEERTTALASVLGDVLDGSGTTASYLSAANQLVRERRVLLWSTDTKLQSFIDVTPVAGVLPADNSSTTAYGVYFNAADAAMTSPYLAAKIQLVPALCTNASQTDSQLTLSLTSTQPSGSLTEDILVYGPAGFTAAGHTIAGATLVEANEATIAGRPVSLYRVRLQAGAQATLTLKHAVGGATPSSVAQVFTSPRHDLTSIGLAACS